jgi:hypothetical protein
MSRIKNITKTLLARRLVHPMRGAKALAKISRRAEVINTRAQCVAEGDGEVLSRRSNWTPGLRMDEQSAQALPRRHERWTAA